MNYYFVCENAHDCVKTYLKDLGTVLEVTAHKDVDTAIASHPDIQLVNVKGQLFVAPNMSPQIQSFLSSEKYPFNWGDTTLKSLYPGDIPYNIVVLDQYLLHHIKYTDKKVLELADSLGLKPVHVEQGYSKCSTVVITGNAIITSDMGIEKAVRDLDVDCLLVREGFVALYPFQYGFLGGASGRVGDGLVWNGSLEGHPDREAIRGFVQSKGIKNIEFEGMPLVDIGSIIEWKVE